MCRDRNDNYCQKIHGIFYFLHKVRQHHLYLGHNKVNIPGFNDIIFIFIAHYGQH